MWPGDQTGLGEGQRELEVERGEGGEGRLDSDFSCSIKVAGGVTVSKVIPFDISAVFQSKGEGKGQKEKRGPGGGKGEKNTCNGGTAIKPCGQFHGTFQVKKIRLTSLKLHFR